MSILPSAILSPVGSGRRGSHGPVGPPGMMQLAPALPSSLFGQSPSSSSSGSAETAHTQVQVYHVPRDTNLETPAPGSVLDTERSLKSKPTRFVF